DPALDRVGPVLGHGDELVLPGSGTPTLDVELEVLEARVELPTQTASLLLFLWMPGERADAHRLVAEEVFGANLDRVRATARRENDRLVLHHLRVDVGRHRQQR